jgi:hypothetical protein
LIRTSPRRQKICCQAVAVVVVDVEDRDALAGRPDDRLGRDRGVVEEAVPPYIERAAWWPGGRQDHGGVLASRAPGRPSSGRHRLPLVRA